MRIFQRYVLLEQNDALLQVLGRAGIPCTVERKQFGDRESVTGEFLLFEDDPRFAEQAAAVAPFGLLCQEGTEFSQSERDDAPWSLLQVGQQGYPQPERGWFERTWRAQTSCPRCGCAEEQVAPFRFQGEPKSRHSQFLGLHWVPDAVFVRDEARALLEREGVTGVAFSRPVAHRTGQPLETVWQLEVPTVLPAGLVSSNVRREPCGTGMETRAGSGPCCQRLRFNHPTRGMLTFAKTTFDGAPEVVRSHEWLGSGGQSARPLLVSCRVRQLIEQARLRGATFTPIALVEST